MALPCSGAASAPLPVPVVVPQPVTPVLLHPPVRPARPTPVRSPPPLPQLPQMPQLPQLLQPPAARVVSQTLPVSPGRASVLTADGNEARWDGLLRGVSRSEDAFGKRRRLSRTDPIEIRADIWRHRDVLMPGIREAAVALEATSYSGSVGSPLPSDPELLRGMLCEMLLWCAPSETPAAILRAVKLQRSPDDDALDSDLAELELGDLVTVAVNAVPQPGWTAVVPLCFGQGEPQKMLQWTRKTELHHVPGATATVGWLRKSDPSEPSLRGCSSAPRTLAALAAQAASATASSPEAGSSAPTGEGGGGARAGELLHNYLRGLALADGLQKTAQQMLLAVCDILRGKSTAAAQTQKLKIAGADVPVPKDEMAAALRWVYSSGMTDAAGVVEHQGERYVAKGRLITAMTVHAELHAKYVLRHAHKRQYLSSWAKASVEHCMRVELYPWLTQTFEKANAVNPWFCVVPEDDPLVELLNQTLSQTAAGSTAAKNTGSFKNKWWYRILATPDTMPTNPLPGYGAGAAASGNAASLATVAAQGRQSQQPQVAASSGPDPLVDLPAMDASMLGAGHSIVCKQPTHVGASVAIEAGELPRQRTEVGTDRKLELDKTHHLACLRHLGVSGPEATHASSAANDGGSATDVAAGGLDTTGLIFT